MGLLTPTLVLTLAAATLASQPTDLTAKAIAEYRLTPAAFERFVHASRLIAEATANDPALARNPPFTREVAVLGDVAEVAPALEARFRSELAFAAALTAAKMTARDYTVFALALIGARLAHGFVKSGAMRFVPPGLATDNVAFVAAHESDVVGVLMLLGVE